MDGLTSSILAFKQADLQMRIDYSVARKMLDTQEASGDAAVKMIRAAAESQKQALSAVQGIGSSGIAGLGECVDCRG